MRRRAARPSAGRLVALCALSLGALAAAAPAAAQTGQGLVSIEDVSVESREGVAAVHVRTSAPPRYEASTLDRPPRLVIDIPDAAFAWRRSPLKVEAGGIKEIRGSQHRPRVARIVIELTARTDYHIESDPQGLRLVLQPPKVSPGSPAPTGPGPAATGSRARPGPPPRIVLYGIVHSDAGGVAYMADPETSNVARYRVGDTVGGATVEAIEPEHVVLTGPAGRFELWLGDAKPAPASPGSPSGPAPKARQ